MQKLTYYVRRLKRKTGIDRHKTLHAADSHRTFCGRWLDEMWYIEEDVSIRNLTINDVTCKECKRQIKKRIKGEGLK